LKQNKNNKTVSAIITVIFIVGFIYAAFNGINLDEKKIQNPTSKPDTKQGAQTESTKNSNTAVSGELKVSFIDVGQADSILLQQGDKFMLIDAGNNGDVQTVKDYLTSQGVKELQYFIGTHKDEDHIGGADGVINSLKVGKVYFPKQVATTQTYKDFVTAVKNKGLSLTVPKVGEQFKLGEAAVTVLAPNSSEYEDSNDYSIVVKVTFGSTTFLLTGDAEALSEKELVASGKDLSATLLKVGHHGSLTSTSQAFLDKVNPKFAVISAGAGNKYGHPAQETMDKLKAKGVQVFRTDEQKTIIATSNGKEINFNVKPGSYKGITK
jgi:competence protein ComEC